MAHFAELNQENIVLRVVVIDNDATKDDAGHECEALGIEFCQQLFGADTKWKQTSYNCKIRKNYAGVGYVYDEMRDAFIPPPPYKSWTLNETTCQWMAPKQPPSDGKPYTWDEGFLRWVVLS
jgi:hypothetical protein